MKRSILVWLFLLLVLAACSQNSEDCINLSGVWELCLDSTNAKQIDQLSFDHSVKLPGTLDDAGIGKTLDLKPKLKREVMLHLYRKHEYIGKAWYKKTITFVQKIENTGVWRYSRQANYSGRG
ncbi:hypothetical protein [Sunxiuqinia indica]|uniref:hypothetical protein n=1 Tax=Sunxiuqinia indica TaxID=2692584 RepID=UPI00135AFD4C|nr:hypothetical protein [Sunxiuqinia indica]